MYEKSETVVRCVVGTTESFKVKVGLHQGSSLNSFLFAVIMDRLTDEVRREPPWTMLFADDIVICEETREEVEWRLESLRYALERRGMKRNRSKIEYLCINGGNDNETVKMEDRKVPSLSFEGHPLQVRHKQDWGRGFILLLPQTAVLPPFTAAFHLNN